jgi:hypothetical protein
MAFRVRLSVSAFVRLIRRSVRNMKLMMAHAGGCIRSEAEETSGRVVFWR